MQPFATRCNLAPIVGPLLLAASTGTVSAATFAVGAGGAGGAGEGCSHTTIQAAVDAAALDPEADTIFVARDQSYTSQAITISGFSALPGDEANLLVLGGVARCNAPFELDAPTPLAGTGGAPVIHIHGDSDVNLVLLDIHGSGTYGVSVEGSSTAQFEVVRLRNNQGGLRVDDASAVIYTSEIFGNIGAGFGAGIYCANGSLNVIDTEIWANEATYGGGMSVNAGCLARFGGEVLIRDNNALSDGGGIDIFGGSVDNIPTRGEAPGVGTTTIHNNTAINDGGGIYLSNFGFYNADNTRLVNNEAQGRGGGAHLLGSSILRMERRAGCAGKCVEISGNRTTTEVLGSAVHATGSSEVYLFGGAFNNNRNTGNTAHPLYLDGSSAWFESVEVFGNRGPAIFYPANSSTFTLAFASGAINTTATGANAKMVLVGGADADIYSSAFQDTSGFEVVISGSIDLDCVMSNTLTGATTTAVSVIDDPEFLDPSFGDLRLAPTSPAVDYCDASSYAPSYLDVSGEPRGYDHEDNPNAAPGVPGGIYDLGADETWWFFQDGFESGNTSGWSATRG